MKNLRIHIAYLLMFLVLGAYGSLAFAQTADKEIPQTKGHIISYKVVEGNLVINSVSKDLTEEDILWDTGKYERLVKVNDSTFVLLKKEESFSERLERLTKK